MTYTEPGTTLPNGATVVATTSIRGYAGEHIVLALTNGMASHPYVTWRMDGATGEVFHGDYCMTFVGAIRSYAARSGFPVYTLDDGVDIEKTRRGVERRREQARMAREAAEWADERA